MEAVQASDLAKVQWFFEGAESPFLRAGCAEMGTDALTAAIHNDDHHIVEYLVASGAKLPPDAFGDRATPLEMHYLAELYKPPSVVAGEPAGPLYVENRDPCFGALDKEKGLTPSVIGRLVRKKQRRMRKRECAERKKDRARIHQQVKARKVLRQALTTLKRHAEVASYKRELESYLQRAESLRRGEDPDEAPTEDIDWFDQVD